MSLKLKKGDIMAIAAVLLLAAAVFWLFLPRETAAYAEIYLDGERIRTVDLSVDQQFTVTGRHENTVTVAGGKIAVTATDCPTRDCISSGWVGTSGRSIVCLPNGMEIRVVSKSVDVDFVVG